ncbi:MAG: class I SAM-dependent methyltransferase [Myxococcota bacterium]
MTPHDLVAAAQGLTQTSDGLWTSSSEVDVSYPEGDHDQLVKVEDRSFWFDHRNRCLAEWVAQHPPAGPVLDVGAGNGFVTRGLAAAGIASVALEPSEAGARNAQARGLDPVIWATLEDAQFPPHSVPAVGLFDVLEHVEDRRALLAHLHSRLQPDGRVYLTVPALRWLWSSEDVRAGHYLRYTGRTLRAELVAGGFRVEAMRRFFSFLVPPVLLARVVAERLGLRQDGPEALANDLAPPHPWVRAAVDLVGAAERRMLGLGLPLPLGTSLFAVATPR